MTSVRRPTDQEFAAYDGMHCANLWRGTGEDWECPVCGRTKREILRWGERVGSNAERYGRVGWKAGLQRYRDRGRGFGEVVVCGSCGCLGARIKRRLGIRAREAFTPEELRACVRFAPANEAITDEDVDWETAHQISRRLGWCG